jgi:hypothetical protein
VEIWEAVLTFLFFPILVIVAYAADKGWLNVLFCQVIFSLSSMAPHIHFIWPPALCRSQKWAP